MAGEPRDHVRRISKLLFGNRLRLETAAAIATDPGEALYARALAQRLDINDNQAAAELKTLERAGLLERVPHDAGGPTVLYRRVPSAYWKHASEVFQETWDKAAKDSSVASSSDAASNGRLGRSPLLRLQSDEKLIALVRKGDNGAYEALVQRYQPRLLAFCRHMLGSQEDAEEVLQEVFTAAYSALVRDDGPINARPWVYRVARNRCLDRLRMPKAARQESMDIHNRDHKVGTAEVHRREAFRETVADVGDLPEAQRAALLLREIDGLSYNQIAEAMDMTVPGVKALLVRARVNLVEAEETRLSSGDQSKREKGTNVDLAR